MQVLIPYSTLTPSLSAPAIGAGDREDKSGSPALSSRGVFLGLGIWPIP